MPKLSLTVTIPVKIVTYKKEQYEKWVGGDRSDCPDKYCCNLPGAYGFGEYIADQFFAAQGYKWIHHGFNILGGNRPGKYPEAEDILIKYFGSDIYNKARQLYPLFKPFEEPDLMIYKPDLSEVRFAEAKKAGSGDKLRLNQIKGLVLLAVLLGCKIDVIEIIEEGKEYTPQDITWEF